MDSAKNRLARIQAWVAVAAVAALCLTLGILQYRWIGEVSLAERERMLASLRGSVQRLSRDFNSELISTAAALMPQAGDRGESYEHRYSLWKEGARHLTLYRRMAVARTTAAEPSLLLLDPSTGSLREQPWPADWELVRKDLTQRFSPEPGPRRAFSSYIEGAPNLIAVPRLQTMEPGPPPGRERRAGERSPDGGRYMMRDGPRGPSGDGRGPGAPPWMGPEPNAGPGPGPDRREPPMPGRQSPGPQPFRQPREILLLELDPVYVRSTLLPELIQRHFGDNADEQWQFEITPRDRPSELIFSNERGATAPRLGAAADLRQALFDVGFEQVYRRGLRDMQRNFEQRTGLRGPGDFTPPDRGRWSIAVRHRAGSLEAVVNQLRYRNLAISGLVLLLMLAAVGLLLTFTQRAQRLAQLQMNFVAGVSHELRTPLSVIRTAAHNLSSGVVKTPKQSERYGALIEDEVERLTAILEGVLRFAAAKSGKAITRLEPVEVMDVIDDAVKASTLALERAQCALEQSIEPGLPLVMADRLALAQALQNLLANAAKYGAAGQWVGLSAARAGSSAIEISVSDRGAGIEPDELRQIFDPFFRGRWATENQIHGTGLGLSIVKGIVDAHHGAIEVRSSPGQGTRIALRLPAIAPEQIT